MCMLECCVWSNGASCRDIAASMRHSLVQHLLAQLVSLLSTVAITTVFLSLLALCLQLPRLQHAHTLRALCGMALAAALMITSPLIYRREGQHMGIGLATMTYMAALTMFDWCLLQPTAATPSVRQMLSSFVWQPMSGIISAHQQTSRARVHRIQAHGTSAAVSDIRISSPAGQRQQQLSRKQLLQQAATPMLRVMLLIDVLSAVLKCFLCYGNVSLLILKQSCSNNLSTGALTLKTAVVSSEAADALLSTPLQYTLGLSNILPLAVLRYLSHAVVSFLTTLVAGFLLGLQLEFTYMTGRLLLIVVGYPNPGPVHIFNQPWMAASITDLWSSRWHQVLRYYFTGLGYELADTLTAGLIAIVDRLRCYVCCMQARRVPMQTLHHSSGSSTDDSSATGSSSSLKQGTRVVKRRAVNKKGLENSSCNTAADGAASAATAVPQQQFDSADNPAAQQQNESDKPTAAGCQRQLRRMMRTLVVFAISGVVHEYVCWGAFGVATGQHLLFFMLHGLAVVIEGLCKQFSQQQQQGDEKRQMRNTCALQTGVDVYNSSSSSQVALPMWLRRLWVVMFSLCTAPLFINVYLRHWHFQSYVPPFLVPVTASLLQRIDLCNCC